MSSVINIQQMRRALEDDEPDRILINKRSPASKASKPISICAVRDCTNSKHVNKVDPQSGESITYHKFPKSGPM